MKEYKYTCPICKKRFTFPIKYSIFKLICVECEDIAVDENGYKPWHSSLKDEGSDPLYIDGIKCHRRYKFGGFITMTYESWENFLKQK